MREKITTIFFAALLGAISLVNFLMPDKGFSENENRYLASRPKFSLQKLFLGSYTEDFESYITDQFPARDSWVKLKGQVELAIGKKDNGSVYFGKDGYLLDKYSEGTSYEVQLQKNLSYLNSFLERVKNYLPESNVTVMLAPTKEEILQHKLPDYAVNLNQGALIDKAIDQLGYGSFIDLREALSQVKDEYIYYRTDHHWTTKGAFEAYRQWCLHRGLGDRQEDSYEIVEVTDSFLGTTYSKANMQEAIADSISLYKPLSNIEYKLNYNYGEYESTSLYELKYLEGKDKYALFLKGNNGLINIKTSNHNGKRLLIIKDSYANSFIPFIANDFEEVHVVDLRYGSLSLVNYIEENNIDELLVLYNIMGFAEDRDVVKLLR